jgi:hypothetical protein
VEGLGLFVIHTGVSNDRAGQEVLGTAAGSLESAVYKPDLNFGGSDLTDYSQS